MARPGDEVIHFVAPQVRPAVEASSGLDLAQDGDVVGEGGSLGSEEKRSLCRWGFVPARVRVSSA